MGKILVFRDLLESLKVKPQTGYILLGGRDFSVGSEPEKSYDVIFHIRDGPNVSYYQDRASLIIPVLESKRTEREVLEDIALVYQVHSANETFCVNCFSPRFYRVIGRYGRARHVSEESVQVVDREQFYGLIGFGRKSKMEQRIAELDEES